jgi:hypothetical protein
MVHELAHQVHSHHSKEFWATVDRSMPDMEHRKRWLRENGGRYLKRYAQRTFGAGVRKARDVSSPP